MRQMGLVRFHGKLAIVDKEEIYADERRWVRIIVNGAANWVPKDATTPFTIEIPEKLRAEFEALRPKEI